MGRRARGVLARVLLVGWRLSWVIRTGVGIIRIITYVTPPHGVTDESGS